ncbi:MAG: phosphatase PAP2 family protein [Solirubrobacteraceae bacterium]
MDPAPIQRPSGSPLHPLLAAALAATALVATGALAFGSDAVRFRDAAALHSFETLGWSLGIEAEANRVGHLADPLPVGLLLLALMAVALVRGRPRTAGVVAAVVLGANLTTQILKPALAHPRLSEILGGDQVPAASWPSGHSTAAMSIALCAVLVSSSRWRPAVAIAGATFAVAVGYSLLALAWHFPSDVLGGYLVAATWALAGAGALRAADRRWPARTGREAAVRLRDALAPSAAAVGAAGAAGVAALLLRPGAVVDETLRHTTMVASGLAVGMLGLAVATGLVLALRR